jgi:beta-glucanase (GH16 family)
MRTVFWLNYRPPPYSPEPDIMEQTGSRPMVTTGTLHSGPPKRSYAPVVNENVGIDPTADFHTYGGLWIPDHVAWYFDGQLLGFSTAGRRPGVGYYNCISPIGIRINSVLGTGIGDPQVGSSELPTTFETMWYVILRTVSQIRDAVWAS